MSLIEYATLKTLTLVTAVALCAYLLLGVGCRPDAGSATVSVCNGDDCSLQDGDGNRVNSPSDDDQTDDDSSTEG